RSRPERRRGDRCARGDGTLAGMAAVTAGGLTRPAGKSPHPVEDTAIGVGPGHVADEAAVVLVPADQADRGRIPERQVEESLDHSARLAVLDGVGLDVVAGLEFPQLRPVGDHAHRAGLGARAEEGPLRTFQHLDAVDVIEVKGYGSRDGGDRLLVEVYADAGLGSGMIAVAAAHDASDVDDRAARLAVIALSLAA